MRGLTDPDSRFVIQRFVRLRATIERDSEWYRELVNQA